MESLFWPKMLGLAIGGMLGTFCRFGLGELMKTLAGTNYPWGTLLANGLGCLGFGLLGVIAIERQLLSRELHFILTTGFMGAFTTFSTYAFDTTVMFRDHHWIHGALHLLGQNVLGIGCILLGMWIGSLLPDWG